MSLDFAEPSPSQTVEGYRQLNQGIRIFHEHQHPDVDILAIPGLGTNPEECWTWQPSKKKTKTPKSAVPTPLDDESNVEHQEAERGRKFNWIRDPEGIASLFEKKSRIMLYDYASAYSGRYKVKATMKSICTWLLADLKEKRKEATEINRPLIMIGHSMGGIVIAKALSMARTRREFEPILTSTVGCLFFGAPFRGTNMAKMALSYTHVFGEEAYESLLHFMKAERNDALDEVTSDFMEISTKLDPQIQLFCAWEMVPTDQSYAERFAQTKTFLQNKAIKNVAQAAVNIGTLPWKTGTHFVDKDSAVLQGAFSIGLQADHRDLIKFESIDSQNSKFLHVRSELEKMFRSAKKNVRQRTLRSGQNSLTQRTVNQVRRSLEGIDMGVKFRARERERSISSWLTSEPLYQAWLSTYIAPDPNSSYLWLKGGPGLGKTNASLAAIQHLAVTSMDHQIGVTSDQNGTFVAYFLCEWTSGCSTAEEILKSLITQLINQDESLAQHGARWFVSNPRYRGPSYIEKQPVNEEMGAAGAKATATVDNLWKCLQEMVDDPAVHSVHFIINNMHVLESGGSTTALLSKLRDHALSLEDQPPADRRVKWLITSRGDRHICDFLKSGGISVIDLENDHEYGTKVRQARQRHAKDVVHQLRSDKQYSYDLAWYVRNSIDSQSEDETWIDILCTLLRAMPSTSTDLTIRKWLREVSSYNTNKLIDHAWNTILAKNQDDSLEIEEILQSLTIAYEPPTLPDLSVLTQIDDSARLVELVQKCSPILQIGELGEHQGKVVFSNAEFQRRLFMVCHGEQEQSSPQKKRYHGLMALRCFKYIKTWYKITKKPARLANIAASLIRSPSTSRRVNGDNLIDLDDDIELGEPLSPQLPSPDCAYPIKYLFKHLSEAFPDVAQELCEDDPGFWGQASSLRDAWLKDYQVLTNDLKDLNTNGISALHVAAGIGANELMSVLVSRNGHQSLGWTSDEGMTALHVAAFNNHTSVVDALIRAGADIEAGDGTAGTALHLAALRGNCDIITLLTEKGANVNALGETIGPVINAAIRSGTVDAVKQVMDRDVRFDLDYTKCDAPLSLSARMSEPSLFEDILQTGREKWLQNVKLLDQALIAASYSGRIESVRILLKFSEVYTNNTLEKAILSAAIEKHWTTTIQLLDYAILGVAEGVRRDVQLDDIFYLAATSREDRIDVLERIWILTNGTVAQETRNFSLYQATVIKKDATVVWLLDTCGANVNAAATVPVSVTAINTTAALSSDLLNPLNAAATSGNIALVRSLLDRGAEINDEGGYALHLAASEGHTNIVELLLERGALVNRKVADSTELGFFGSTALQVACENNRVSVVDVLIKNAADPNLGGGPLTNPITAATQSAQPDILKLLLQAPGIDVNVKGGDDQSTPLINAASNMSKDSVELLIYRGANVNATNAIGDTALIMAASRGDRACVDMLCDNDADVTYRSPQRGLAIQVAAKGLHPLCAHSLAERMGGTIDDYREKGLSDLVAAKKRLAELHAELKNRDCTIDTLNDRLSEANEQLEIATRDTESHQLENQRLKSISSLQGETYESVNQQMKAIQNERVELLKQLDATKGQVELANATIARVQALLEEERQTNAALRKRQGYAALQEEKKAALELAEQEKQAALEFSKHEEQKREELTNEVQALQFDIYSLKSELQSTQTSMQIAIEESKTERQQKEDMEKDVGNLHAKIRELQERLTTYEAAATKMSQLTSSPRSPSNDAAEVVQKQDYFAQHANPGDSATETHTLGESPGRPRKSSRKPVASPMGSPLVGSLGEYSDEPGSLYQYPSSQHMNGRTPSFPPESGFRTIHGQHRADGSLGGYRKDRLMKRTTSDSLYTSSVKNGSGGKASMSNGSLNSADGNRQDLGDAW